MTAESQRDTFCSSRNPDKASERVSVCMASFNGSRYIEQQLRSILDQSEPVDELVIVDDHSTDSTLEIIRQLNDPRITLYQNSTNIGPVGSFERALTSAKGNILFLSDQDDIWNKHKVARFKKYFDENPDVTVALSDAVVIDQTGALLSNSWTSAKGFNPSLIRNLIQNRFLGCVMAFRREVLNYALPFPAQLPMHDMWIGMVNEIFGKAGYLDEPLVSYRRHGANVTTGRHAGITQMLQWRWILVRHLLTASMRRKPPAKK